MCSGAARRARGDLPTGGVIPLTSRGLPARLTARFGTRPVLLAGLVSGLFNTTQQVGAAAGVVLLSAIAAARTGQLRAAGQLLRPRSPAATTSRSAPGPRWPRWR
jgi:hypothetical protein